MVQREASRFRGGFSVTVVTDQVTDEIVAITWVNPRNRWGQLTLAHPRLPTVSARMSGLTGEFLTPPGYPWSDRAETSLNIGVVY